MVPWIYHPWCNVRQISSPSEDHRRQEEGLACPTDWLPAGFPQWMLYQNTKNQIKN